MAKYVDPMTDTGFKIIFGKENQSNEILMSLLNELLKGQDGFEPIVSLRYLNNERTRETEYGRTIVHDIICETDKGHRFIVEMQKAPKTNFLKRSVFYVARAISEQGIKGLKENEEKWNYETLPVIGVFISNFLISELDKKLVTHARLCDVDSHKPIGDAMRYVFVQLPVFKKDMKELSGYFDELIYTLKNMGTMDAIPFTSHKDIFDRLARVGNVAALSREERIQYEYDLKKARDYNAEIEYIRTEGRAQGIAEGRAKGIAEGRAKGIAEGRAEEKFAIAARMFDRGIDIGQISVLTDIPVSELKSHFGK